MKNEQWVLRTWDGRHVAVDQDGNLTVEDGCVKTTFLRVIMSEDLADCLIGINCSMFLCATSLSAGNSTYFMASISMGTLLQEGQCLTSNRFAHSKTLERFGSDLRNFRFTFVQAISDHARSMLSNRLRRLCPRAFDPHGELVGNKCKS
jgi:hypothetical protein